MGMLDRYLLMKPSVRGVIEWCILAASGVYAYSSSVLILPFRTHFIISGVILFVLGQALHALSHKEHRQAHSRAEEVGRIVTTGIYSKVRHPGYLGLILSYLGASLCFQSLVPILIAVALSALLVLTALKEEECLLKRFGKEYEEYMRRVPWRFVPKLF